MLVLTEKNGPIFTVIINRPEVRNAVDRPTAEALADAFGTFEEDKEALVAVFTGVDGCFCAGADLKALANGLYHRMEEEGDGPMGPTRMRLSKPVIAAVAGYAVAGGMELAIWCDLRVAEKGAVFGMYDRRWGVPMVDGCTVRLPQLIGFSRAMDLILTGRPVEAEEAYQIGLVNRLVEPGKARAEAEALAGELARFPWRCLLSDRQSAYEAANLPYEAAMRNEFRLGLKTIESGETLEGATRFAKGSGRHGSFEEFK